MLRVVHRRMLRAGWRAMLLWAVALPSSALAHPEFATNCSACHGNVAKMDATPKSGSTLAFGKVLVGGAKSLDIKISNTSTAAKGGGFAGTMPGGSGPFSRSGDGKLATTFGGFLLPVGIANSHPGGVSSATFTYTYAPAVRGIDSLDLAFKPSAGFTSGTAPTASFKLAGEGVAPVVSVDAARADLGHLRLGTTGLAAVTIRNAGDGNQAGAGIGNLLGSVGGSANGFVGQGGGFDLPDNGSLTFEFVFSPTARGAASADIAITTTNGSDDNKNLAQNLTAKLAAVAVGPILGASVAPDSTIDFGKTVAPLPATRTLALSNATTDADLGGLTNLGLLSAAITGADAALFSLQNFTPGVVLSKSQIQDIQLLFSPAAGAVGPASATLTIVTDEGAAPGQNGRTVSFALAGLAALESYWKGAGGAWNSSAGSMNWVVGPGSSVESAALPNASTDVFFAANGQSSIQTTLGQDFTIRSLSFAPDAPPTTIAGNVLTLRGGIAVGAGTATHTISSQIQLAAAQRWNVDSGSSLVVSGAVGGPASAKLEKSGGGRLVLGSANSFAGGLTVTGGTLLVTHPQGLPAGTDVSLSGANTALLLAGGLNAAVRLGALNFDGLDPTPQAAFDLANNRLVIDGRLTTHDALAAAVKAAYAGGAWNGPGLASSAAAADALAAGGKGPTAVGFASNSDFGLGLATFGDVPVDAASLLIRYTLLGDANLDAKVDLADFLMLRKNYGQNSNVSWSQGDFNYDGAVDLDDFVLLRAEFGLSLTTGPTGNRIQAVGPPIDWNLLVVPEPGAATLLALGGCCGLAGAAGRRLRARARGAGNRRDPRHAGPSAAGSESAGRTL